MTYPEHRKGRGRKIATTAVLFIFAGLIIHWSWNSFAVEILGAKQLEFKHSIALELLLITLASIFPLVWHLWLPPSDRNR